MSGRRRLAALALAAFAGACAPRATVRAPGQASTQGAPAPTVFAFRGPADAVALRGTMTGWDAVPLEREGDRFVLAISLASGRYEYRFEVRRGAELRIVLPEDAERVDDGFGGENAVLRVP
ncbi:glycogen-binding domain-containing protein [Anaeromyxobacter dehalogenans]|uniref:glycogen-binding domain-containing protein n=1 Tax=Anaeromyxobacter dehalogenans TaxID=161493 RepID=UPI00059DC6A0|nr:glycogen-binding domain-containing protein [Anaeromyxobacter dehalogenans]